jgi:hypothetical protein
MMIPPDLVLFAIHISYFSFAEKRPSILGLHGKMDIKKAPPHTPGARLEIPRFHPVRQNRCFALLMADNGACRHALNQIDYSAHAPRW